MKKKFLKLIAVMLCLMLVLSACSKDEPAKNDTPTTTEAPTEKPTEALTEKPTEAPTEVPTEAPTEAPTEEPTEAPTEAPTEEPTEAPTEAPEEPTEVPTEEPTAEPTAEPVIDDNNGGVPVDVDFDDIPEDGREFTKEDITLLVDSLVDMENKRSYTYMNIEMSMDYAGQAMLIYMTETAYKYDNMQHNISANNMLGADMVIETYEVTDESGNITSYNSYDGGTTWSKSDWGSSSSSTLLTEDSKDKFIDSFTDGWIVEKTDGYSITGKMDIEYQEGLIIPLNCEFLIDFEGNLKRYTMTLAESFDAEENGMKVTVEKFDMDFEADSPEIEIPEEALNAGEASSDDLSGILGGLLGGLDDGNTDESNE